jgi:RNA polymerase sigma factor (sigma-70 family)
MGDAASLIPARVSLAPLRSKRLLALARDETLVDQIRRGNEAAFEVAFERHGAGLLGFCRHMLGSPEEAEDAVQHTFAAAFHDLQRHGERSLALKPWLYAIARNRCISVLRSRRERATEHSEPVTAGLAEQVERRDELRDMLRDLSELPEDQRAALLLAEASGLSQIEIAGALGCKEARVKALVFRARSALIQRRAARETPCEEIREQLANLRGGSLRRSGLRHHLRECAGCRAYREQVRQQRRMLAAALPVAPSLGLKSSVLAAVGLGGGSAAGLGGAGAGSLGSATLAKVALVGVLAGGGAVAGKTAIDEASRQPERPPHAAHTESPAAAPARATTPSAGRPARLPDRTAPSSQRDAPTARERERREVAPPDPGTRRRRGADGPSPSSGSRPPARGPLPRERAPRGQGNGLAHGHSKPTAGPGAQPLRNGRGPIEAPPQRTPVKRGPPTPKPAANRPSKVRVKAPATPRAPKATRPASGEPNAKPESSPVEAAPKTPDDQEPAADSVPTE